MLPSSLLSDLPFLLTCVFVPCGANRGLLTCCTRRAGALCSQQPRAFWRQPRFLKERAGCNIASCLSMSTDPNHCAGAAQQALAACPASPAWGQHTRRSWADGVDRWGHEHVPMVCCIPWCMLKVGAALAGDRFWAQKPGSVEHCSCPSRGSSSPGWPPGSWGRKSAAEVVGMLWSEGSEFGL